MPSLGIELGSQWWEPLALCEKEQWRAIVQNDSFRNSLQWQSYIINSFDKPIHLFFWKHLFHCAKTQKMLSVISSYGHCKYIQEFFIFFWQTPDGFGTKDHLCGIQCPWWYVFRIMLNILHTVLYTIFKVLIGRICSTINSFLSWWSFSLIHVTLACDSGVIL